MYLQLQAIRRAEYGRTQRLMCSWLYKLRACDEALRPEVRRKDGAAAAATRAASSSDAGSLCRRVEPPDEPEPLGWRGHKVNSITDLAPLLFAFRCW